MTRGRTASSLNIFCYGVLFGFEAVKWSKREVVEIAWCWALRLFHRTATKTRKLSTELVWMKSIVPTWGKFSAFKQLLLITEETNSRPNKINCIRSLYQDFRGIYYQWSFPVLRLSEEWINENNINIVGRITFLDIIHRPLFIWNTVMLTLWWTY